MVSLAIKWCCYAYDSSPHHDKHPQHWPWWRHKMETYSALLAICAGNSPVNSPHKGQWRGALMFSLICVWINSWVNTREAGDLRCHRAHYDVIVMTVSYVTFIPQVAQHPSGTYMINSTAQMNDDKCLCQRNNGIYWRPLKLIHFYEPFPIFIIIVLKTHGRNFLSNRISYKCQCGYLN